MKKTLKLLTVLFTIALVISLSACGGEKKVEDEKKEEVEKTDEEVQKTDSEESESGDDTSDSTEEKGEEKMANNPVVTISTKIGDKELADMKLELYPEKAPNTVANFITLAQDGYYDGLIFHRIIPQFMIQGGDPTGTGMGGPGYGIKGEFSMNGFKENDIAHKRGVISMARSQMPDSAGSQFFIVHEDAPHLDGQYAAFGMLIEGEESLDELATTQTAAQDRPVTDCVMTKVTVELNGYELPEVEKN